MSNLGGFRYSEGYSRDEIVTALRECGDTADCQRCPMAGEGRPVLPTGVGCMDALMWAAAEMLESADGGRP